MIVDQTPKMLNSDDWAYGFYDYDASNADTLFATGIPDPKRHSIGSKGPVRIARLLKAMDLKAAKAGFTPAELELLNDHAKRDWRPTIAAAQVPVLFVAGRESEFWPCEHAAAAASLTALGDVGGRREGRSRDEHRAAEGVRRAARPCSRLARALERLAGVEDAPAGRARP